MCMVLKNKTKNLPPSPKDKMVNVKKLNKSPVIDTKKKM